MRVTTLLFLSADWRMFSLPTVVVPKRLIISPAGMAFSSNTKVIWAGKASPRSLMVTVCAGALAAS